MRSERFIVLHFLGVYVCAANDDFPHVEAIFPPEFDLRSQPSKYTYGFVRFDP